jgi:hypothetical protein
MFCFGVAPSTSDLTTAAANVSRFVKPKRKRSAVVVTKVPPKFYDVVLYGILG